MKRLSSLLVAGLLSAAIAAQRGAAQIPAPILHRDTSSVAPPIPVPTRGPPPKLQPPHGPGPVRKSGGHIMPIPAKARAPVFGPPRPLPDTLMVPLWGPFADLDDRPTNGAGRRTPTFERYILLENTSSGERALWQIGPGAAITTSADLGYVPVEWHMAAMGDFNADGYEDIVWDNTIDGTRVVWLMGPAATVTDAVSLGVVDTTWHIAGAGDFDGDGREDLLWEQSGTGSRAIWFMDGGTVLSAPDITTLDPVYHMTAGNDYNGDGKDDILLENWSTGDTSLWLMNGATIMSAISLGTVTTDWHIVGAGDTDGDGNEDILWESSSTGARAVWLMNGHGVVFQETTITYETPVWHITGILIPQIVSDGLSLAGVNPAGSTARDECLTIAAGDAAAYECGDLRVAHTLPSVRTMNRTRAPTLIYNSRHAKPSTLFAGNLLVRGTTPTAVKRILALKNKAADTASVTWNTSCTNEAVCRIVAARDAIAHSDTTGWYPYTMEVDVSGPDSSTDRGIDTSSAIIINRSQSPFGAGWWIDGLEQLIHVDTAGTTQLWIGGDGSTRLYIKTAVDSIYTVRDLVDRPDTLLRLPGLKWRRLLVNGAFVQFDSLGRHAYTVNRQKDTTTFFNSTRLDSIYLPTPAGAKRKYAFTYTSGVLSSITAPSASGGARSTTIGHGSTYQVTSITDPDGFTVHFGYDSTGLRVASRVNKLGDTTFYQYDTAGGLTQASVSMSRSGESALVTAFCPAETRSLVSCAGDGATAIPQLLANTVTRLDGPRTDSVDVTTFFVNRFGAPDTVVDAHANRTRAQRSATFPALATNLFDATGHELRAYYNARGLADSTIDVAPFGGSNAVTKYKWDAKWAMADTITAPTGEVTYISVDATTGNRLWERVGANDSTKTRFAYNARNQVDTVITPSHSGTQRVAYDATLGNDSSLTSPMGFHTDYVTDFVGQDTIVSTPTDAAQTASLRTIERRTYDVMGRLVTDSTRGASFSYSTVLGVVDTVPARSLAVHDTLDAEGELLVRWRYSVPLPSTFTTQITNFHYDAAHRVRRHLEANGGNDSTWYDPAGNPIGQRSARGKTIVKTFDTLNRLVRRVVPGDSVPGWNCECENSGVNPPIRFPYYATIVPGGDSIPDIFFPADTEAFSYDATGRMVFAGNGNARVRRAYFANGSLQAERDSLRAYDPSDTLSNQWGRHIYSMHYTYDLSARRTARSDTVGILFMGTQSYHYNPTLGLLDTTSDTPFGGTAITIGQRYDAAGRLISRATSGGGGTETRTYDDDDRLATRTNPTFTDAFAYDARGKVDSVRSGSDVVVAPYGADTAQMHYDGFGALVGSSRHRGNVSTDDYAVDALGNVLSHAVNRGSTDKRNTMNSLYAGPHIGQVNTDSLKGERATSGLGPLVQTLLSTFFLTDSSGNQSQTGTTAYTWHNTTIVGTDTTDVFDTASAGQAVSASSYDGAERLRFLQRSVWFLTSDSMLLRRTTMSEYLYDALGRRILVRTQKDGGCGAGDPSRNDSDCVQPIERFLWDGSQRLLELRDYGDPSAPLNSYLNLDGTSPGNFFGSVRYTNLAAVDAPLLIAKGGGTPFVPEANWAGAYEAGTVIGGGSTGYNWPGVQQDFYMASDARIATIYPNGWYGDVLNATGGADPAGTVYFRNRYYDPLAGQFTQADPVGLAGGLNVYGYATGDPVNSRDPFGLWPTFPGLASQVSQATVLVGLQLKWPEIESRFNEGARDFSSLLAVGGGLEGLLGGAAAARPAMGARYMGTAEASSVEKTGTIPATNFAGRPRSIHYTADAPLTSGTEARAVYMLPQTPTHVCMFPLCNVLDDVAASGSITPGATQAATSMPINGAGRPIPIKP